MQGPKESDRAQVRSREVKIPNQPPIPLDDTDIEIVRPPSSYDLLCTSLALLCLLVNYVSAGT
jgi:nuclear pore complex protein Nup205